VSNLPKRRRADGSEYGGKHLIWLPSLMGIAKFWGCKVMGFGAPHAPSWSSPRVGSPSCHSVGLMPESQALPYLLSEASL